MKRQLTIAHITNNYTPYSGGVVHSIDSLVGGLQQQGHNPFIITLDFLGDAHDDPEHVVRVTAPIKFMYKKKHCAIPWRCKKWIKRFIQQVDADIVHVHHPFLLGAAGVQVARDLGLPVVFTYHTMYEQYFHYVPFFKKITQPIIKKKVKKFCSLVDFIVVPSNTIKHQLLEQSITKTITCIPSAINSVFLDMPLCTKKRKKNDPFNLLFVSRFEKEKNIPFLLDVFAQLDDCFTFTLCGYGTLYETIKNYAFETLSLSPDRVTFVHKPSHKQLTHFYVQTDCFLFASQTDTQGLVLAEAMAGSTPVVALHGPGQKDIIIDGENGFLVDSKETMKQCIEKIAHDPELHQKLKSGAFKTAQKYSSSMFAEKIIKCYEHLV